MAIAETVFDDPFLEELAPATARKLESCADFTAFQPREMIYFADGRSDTVFWVRVGRVKEFRLSNDGRELTFRHIFAGDLLGEEGIIPRKRRENCAQALVYSELGEVPLEKFSEIVNQDTTLSAIVVRGLIARTQEMERVLAATVFSPVRSRVASGLLRLYEREGDRHECTLRITHQEIANLVGSTRETTTAVLQHLRNDGIVQMANRQLTVLDPQRLAMLAGRA